MKSLLILSLILTCNLSIANVVGTHLQNFNPTTNGLDFVTVESARTLDEGLLNFMLFGNYATNSLTYFSTSGLATKYPEPGDSLVSTNFGIGLGIMQGWDIGISLAAINSQSIDEPLNANLAYYQEKGVTGYGVNTKVRIFNEEKWALALVASLHFDNITDNPFAGNDSGPTTNAQAAFNYQLTQRLLWGLNLGYRFASDGSQVSIFPTLKPLGNQMIYSSALSYYLEEWTSAFILEVYGSRLDHEVELSTDRKEDNLEALLGWRYDWSKRLALHAGIGTELMHGLATPDFRIYAGVHLQLGPLWSHSESIQVSDEDSDYDGLTDENEKTLKTDPNNPDTDGDGLKDGEEANTYFTNPLDPDTDDGGVNDGTEVRNGTDPLSTPEDDYGSTEPLIAEPEEVEKPTRTIELKNVYFSTNSTVITKASRTRLRELIKELLPIRNQIKKLVVEGHTDNVGRNSYNIKLSQGRAESVKKILVKELSLRTSQVQAVGYGESRPRATNKTAKGRAINRRVQLQVYEQ